MMRQSPLVLCSLAAVLGWSAAIRAQTPPSAPAQPPVPPQASPAPPAAASPAPAASPALVAAPAAKPQPQILVPVGTRLPLVLHNGVSTRNARPGDPVYMETLFPILVEGRIVIPAGSYVSGEITEAKRPGRVKGRGEIMLRLTQLILPNGYAVNLAATPSNESSGHADTVDKEGKIKSDSNKGGDAETIAKTTAAGAGVGAIADGLKGAGIGAAAGAAVGLAAVLLTRGPEVELPRGTTFEILLNRPLYLDSERAQFTDPGHSTTLPGPQEQQRSHPFTPF
jgi:hypothetical protein